MNKNDDNEMATKGDIKELRAEFYKGLSHYFGMMMEEVRELFKTHEDNLGDAPERMSKIEENMLDNEDEHRDFRVRIGALERSI